jgi:hypothetical protein
MFPSWQPLYGELSLLQNGGETTMIYFTTEKSAGYGARIFLQEPIYADETNEVNGLHELARELSVWRGSDKTVIILPQDCSEAWAKTGRAGFKGIIGRDIKMSGYEMEAEELAVIEKRCKARGMINITPIIKDMKTDWR